MERKSVNSDAYPERMGNVMDYKLLLDTAVFAGEVLMKSGAETYRVEATMYRIL